MKKRDFIRLASLGVMGITIGSSFLKGCKAGPSKPEMPVWVWMSAGKNSAKKLENKFRELAGLGVHGILIQASEEQYEVMAPLAKSQAVLKVFWFEIPNPINDGIE